LIFETAYPRKFPFLIAKRKYYFASVPFCGVPLPFAWIDPRFNSEFVSPFSAAMVKYSMALGRFY